MTAPRRMLLNMRSLSYPCTRLQVTMDPVTLSSQVYNPELSWLGLVLGLTQARLGVCTRLPNVTLMHEPRRGTILCWSSCSDFGDWVVSALWN